MTEKTENKSEKLYNEPNVGNKFIDEIEKFGKKIYALNIDGLLEYLSLVCSATENNNSIFKNLHNLYSIQVIEEEESEKKVEDEVEEEVEKDTEKSEKYGITFNKIKVPKFSKEYCKWLMIENKKKEYEKKVEKKQKEIEEIKEECEEEIKSLTNCILIEELLKLSKEDTCELSKLLKKYEVNLSSLKQKYDNLLEKEEIKEEIEKEIEEIEEKIEEIKKIKNECEEEALKEVSGYYRKVSDKVCLKIPSLVKKINEDDKKDLNFIIWSSKEHRSLVVNCGEKYYFLDSCGNYFQRFPERNNEELSEKYGNGSNIFYINSMIQRDDESCSIYCIKFMEELIKIFKEKERSDIKKFNEYLTSYFIEKDGSEYHCCDDDENIYGLLPAELLKYFQSLTFLHSLLCKKDSEDSKKNIIEENIKEFEKTNEELKKNNDSFEETNEKLKKNNDDLKKQNEKLNKEINKELLEKINEDNIENNINTILKLENKNTALLNVIKSSNNNKDENDIKIKNTIQTKENDIETNKKNIKKIEEEIKEKLKGEEKKYDELKSYIENKNKIEENERKIEENQKKIEENTKKIEENQKEIEKNEKILENFNKTKSKLRDIIDFENIDKSSVTERRQQQLINKAKNDEVLEGLIKAIKELAPEENKEKKGGLQ